MTMLRKMTGYFKQFVGEVAGSQSLLDQGRREVAADGGYEEGDEQVVPVVPVSPAAPDRVVSAETGRERPVAVEAAPQFAASQADPPVAGTASVFSPLDGRAEAVPAAPVDYADPDRLKLYRLVPVAAPGDTNWDLAPNQGEVIVRARSSGDARVVAAEAELDYLEIDALPGDGNSTTSASAFRNERLYTVIDETDPAYSAEGPRGVVAGDIRVDNIRPTQL